MYRIVLWMLLAMGAGGELAIASPDESVITTRAGQYQGLIDTAGVRSYRGIRYAQSTAGVNRWTPPRRPEKSANTTRAIDYGPACLQPTRVSAAMLKTDEDCLFLNVWTPASESRARLPVMVWIHGAGFLAGDGGIPGEILAVQGVVVVSLN